MRDHDSTDLAGAAYLAREADPGYDDRPSPAEYEDDAPWYEERERDDLTPLRRVVGERPE